MRKDLQLGKVLADLFSNSEGSNIATDNAKRRFLEFF